MCDCVWGVGVWGCGGVCGLQCVGGGCAYDLNTHQVSLEEKSEEGIQPKGEGGIQPKEPSKPSASLLLPVRGNYLNS